MIQDILEVEIMRYLDSGVLKYRGINEDKDSVLSRLATEGWRMKKIVDGSKSYGDLYIGCRDGEYIVITISDKPPIWISTTSDLEALRKLVLHELTYIVLGGWGLREFRDALKRYIEFEETSLKKKGASI